MCTAPVPSSVSEALAMLKSSVGYLADVDATELPVAALTECVRGLVQADSVGIAALAPLLAALDANDAHLADGQRTLRAWLVNVLRVTRGQAAEYKAVQSLARDHEPLRAGLREGDVISKSVALQLAKWTRLIPDEFRAEAEQILIAAARAGADLRALAQICAEIRSRTAPPDPDNNDPDLDRALFLDTTLDGAGVLRGDLTPECAAMVRAVLDALSAPAGGGDLRTRAQRYHDALAEAMKRLLASGLLPQRAGQPVKTSDAVKLSSCPPRLAGGGGEGGGLVVFAAGGQAVVQAAEEAAEQVALGGGVPVAGVFAPVVVGACAG